MNFLAVASPMPEEAPVTIAMREWPFDGLVFSSLIKLPLIYGFIPTKVPKVP
jgi:hypothetical protein